MSQLIRCIVLSGLILTGLSACTYDHTKQFSRKWLGRIYLAEYFDIQRNSIEKIPSDAKIYVRFPTSILGPKADVPQMAYLCEGLQSRFPETYCALRPETHEAALKNAALQQARFLMNAEVIHWNDKQRPNKSEENEKLEDSYFYHNAGVDSIEVGMSIYYVESKKLFDVLCISARSPVIAGYANQPVELLRRGYQDVSQTLAIEKIL